MHNGLKDYQHPRYTVESHITLHKMNTGNVPYTLCLKKYAVGYSNEGPHSTSDNGAQAHTRLVL